MSVHAADYVHLCTACFGTILMECVESGLYGVYIDRLNVGDKI